VWSKSHAYTTVFWGVLFDGLLKAVEESFTRVTRVLSRIPKRVPILLAATVDGAATGVLSRDARVLHSAGQSASMGRGAAA
jgi:hypothetical protein